MSSLSAAATDTFYYATGKRKTSSARIFLKLGSGKMTINGKAINVYLNTPSARSAVHQAQEVTDTRTKYDAFITVSGGGITGQSEAIRHGLAKVLVSIDSETHREKLKKAGFLTRDSRMVERKKYGKRKARRSSQFSKR